jgi:hypothetical protein
VGQGKSPAPVFGEGAPKSVQYQPFGSEDNLIEFQSQSCMMRSHADLK